VIPRTCNQRGSSSPSNPVTQGNKFRSSRFQDCVESVSICNDTLNVAVILVTEGEERKMNVSATSRVSTLIHIDGVAYDVSNLLVANSIQGEKIYPTNQLCALDEGVHCERRRSVDYHNAGITSKKQETNIRDAPINKRLNSDGGTESLSSSMVSLLPIRLGSRSQPNVTLLTFLPSNAQRNQTSEARICAVRNANDDDIRAIKEEMRTGMAGIDSVSCIHECPNKQSYPIALEQSPISHRPPLLGSQLDPSGQSLLPL
jgi:hypothetical protein